MSWELSLMFVGGIVLGAGVLYAGILIGHALTNNKSPIPRIGSLPRPRLRSADEKRAIKKARGYHMIT